MDKIGTEPRTFTHESGYISINMESAISDAKLVYDQDKYEPGKPWRWRIQIETYSPSDRNNYEKIDLFNLLDWLKEHKPDLLAGRGLIIQEKQNGDDKDWRK